MPDVGGPGWCTSLPQGKDSVVPGTGSEAGTSQELLTKSMNRMTDNDKSWGPFTVARWRKVFAFSLESGDDEDPEAFARVIAFGWALRCQLPRWLVRPYKEKKIAKYRDAETIARLGNTYEEIHSREFGFSLSDMGNGYDFFQIHYGRQTHDSSTDKTWSKRLPWKQWDCVRWSVYNPDGSHFATEPRRKKGEKGSDAFFAFCRRKDECPTVSFLFADYDGQEITATCRTEEREWHRGEGWFKWLKWFYRPKIRRSLDLHFSAEVGPEKGSWKGGTLGHGIEMLAGETPEDAFKRYCGMEHRSKHRRFRITYLKPLGAGQA